MKKKRILLIFISIVALCVIILIVAVASMRLEKIGNRPNDFQLSGELRSLVKTECRDTQDVEKLINKCGKIICDHLEFAYRNDISSGKANCVGYAKFHAAILNYAFKLNGMQYKSRPVYGKVYMGNADMHPVLKSIVPKKYEPFFKDHDFTEIDLGDSYLYVDTSIQDVLNYKYSARKAK